jgi:hypothetical protein
MSRLSTPQPGQPIDYSFINDIVSAVNALYTERTLSKVADKPLLTESVQVAAQFKTVISNEKIAPGYVKGFSVDFKTTFQTPPVVTVTAQRSQDTRNEASREVAIVIDNISTTGITGQITFIGTSTGTATIGLNVIAVGISPSQA